MTKLSGNTAVNRCGGKTETKTNILAEEEVRTEIKESKGQSRPWNIVDVATFQDLQSSLKQS